MAPGDNRDAPVRLTPNQTKRDLMQWSHGSCDNEKVAADLEYFTNGTIKLDLSKFVFSKVVTDDVKTTTKKKRR